MTFDGIQLTWHCSPFSLVAILLFCLAYALTIHQLHRHRPLQRPVKKRQILWFACGVLILALLFLTPLDTVARRQLFLAHMCQVVCVVTFAVPCILFACPDWLFQPALAWPLSRMLFGWLTRPLVASLLFNATFLFWHLPVVYNQTLQGPLYHLLLWSLFLVSFLNWWPLIGPERSLHQMSYPAQIAFAFLDGEPLTISAFLLVFSGVVLYPPALPAQFLSDSADQTSAGALLLIPGIVDLVVMSPLFFRWLQQMEERARRDDLRLQAWREACQMAEEAEPPLQSASEPGD